MRFAITIRGPGSDRQGVYQVPGEAIRSFWIYKGESKTFAIAPKFLTESVEFLEEHGVEL